MTTPTDPAPPLGYGTRAQHIAAVKERALAALETSGPVAALTSVNSDLCKHPETAGHDAILLGTMLAMTGHLDTAEQMREWIEGLQ